MKRQSLASEHAGADKNGLIVVGGAGGFIGGALVRHFQARGFTRIRAVDKKPLYSQLHLGVNGQTVEVTARIGWLSLRRERLRRICESIRRFDVLMDDPYRVCGVQGIGNLNCSLLLEARERSGLVVRQSKDFIETDHPEDLGDLFGRRKDYELSP